MNYFQAKIARAFQLTSKCYTDKFYLKTLYYLVFGKKLNISNPMSFNEKLNWLKLYDRKDRYTLMADKYEVKKIVSEIIGDQYVVKNYGVYNSWDDIDFSSLPEQFVIKCTHDSGGGIYL